MDNLKIFLCIFGGNVMLGKAEFLKNTFITFSHIHVTQESLILQTVTAIVNLPYNLALKQFIKWSLWGHDEGDLNPVNLAEFMMPHST